MMSQDSLGAGGMEQGINEAESFRNSESKEGAPAQAAQ